MMRKRFKTGWAIAACLWAMAAVAGLYAVSRYENQPGAAGQMPPAWPQASRLARNSGQATLVMFLHPKCPCSRASVEELARILARCEGGVATKVVAVVPSDSPSGFEDSGLIRSARAIPGVDVVMDRGGGEARVFGAQTSGQVTLYDANGRLVFSGGITGSRGHAGDNAGSDAVLALLTRHGGSKATTPVFGCSLGGECRADATPAAGFTPETAAEAR